MCTRRDPFSKAVLTVDSLAASTGFRRPCLGRVGRSGDRTAARSSFRVVPAWPSGSAFECASVVSAASTFTAAGANASAAACRRLQAEGNTCSHPEHSSEDSAADDTAPRESRSSPTSWALPGTPGRALFFSMVVRSRRRIRRARSTSLHCLAFTPARGWAWAGAGPREKRRSCSRSM